LALKERLEKIDGAFLAFTIGYALVLMLPIYDRVLVKRQLFGYDVPQYILTAKMIIEGNENIFSYPYPLTPLLYVVPAFIVKDPIALYAFGLLASGLIMTTVTATMYFLLKDYVKSDVARIVGALSFGTFLLTLDIIGWGGQSSLLAVVFGLASFIFVRYYFKEREMKFIILASFSLLLSALSEPYISFYFFTSLAVLILQDARHYGLRALLRGAIVLAPCLVTITTFSLKLDLHSKGMALTPLIIYAMVDPKIFEKMLNRLTFGSYIVLLAIFCTLITSLLIRCLAKYQGFNDVWCAVRATGIASIVQILITPAQYADRGMFLVSVPLALMSSTVTEYVAINKKDVVRPLAVICLLFIFLSSGIGVRIYVDSLGFYFVDKDFLTSMLFIRQEIGDVAFISPRPWTFPLAYVTEKNIYPTTQPVWFLRDPQIKGSVLAMSLAWGVRCIDAGEVKVVDATPVWAQPSPAIYVFKYPYYVELFRLSDGALPIAFSPIDNESIVWRESPFYARKIKTWESESGLFSVYMYETLIMSKAVNVSDDNVYITLSYEFIRSYPREIKVRLISLMLPDTRVSVSFSNDTYAQIELLQSFREPWVALQYNTTIEAIVLSPDMKMLVEFIEHDEWGLPEIAITLKPADRVQNVTFLLKVKVNNAILTTPRIVNEKSALKEMNIRWIIVDKCTHPDIVKRFERSSVYEKFAEFTGYIVFKVRQSS